MPLQESVESRLSLSEQFALKINGREGYPLDNVKRALIAGVFVGVGMATQNIPLVVVFGTEFLRQIVVTALNPPN